MNAAAGDPAAPPRRGMQTLCMPVATAAVTIFLAIWGLLFVQLATGHDPAVSNAATSAIVQSGDPELTIDASDDGTQDGAGGDRRDDDEPLMRRPA